MNTNHNEICNLIKEELQKRARNTVKELAESVIFEDTSDFTDDEIEYMCSEYDKSECSKKDMKNEKLSQDVHDKAEKIVKALKRDTAGLKKRYGDDWKSTAYAIAYSTAKKSMKAEQKLAENIETELKTIAKKSNTVELELEDGSIVEISGATAKLILSKASGQQLLAAGKNTKSFMKFLDSIS